MWTKDQKIQRLAELEAELERGTAQLNRIAGAVILLKEELATPDVAPSGDASKPEDKD